MAVGLIGDQSEFIGVLLSTVDELTVYVVNSRESISEEPDDGDETNSGTDSEDENNSSDNNENSEDNPDDGNEDDTTGDDITDIILGN